MNINMSEWLKHVKETMKLHPGKPLKEVLKAAKKTYHKAKRTHGKRHGGSSHGTLEGGRRHRRRRTHRGGNALLGETELGHSDVDAVETGSQGAEGTLEGGRRHRRRRSTHRRNKSRRHSGGRSHRHRRRRHRTVKHRKRGGNCGCTANGGTTHEEQ